MAASLWKKISRILPVKLLVTGYLAVVFIGFLLLLMPLMQKTAIHALDNFFIAASAVSTTGLTTISVSDNYTITGQIIILLLIQIGGIGYMSIGSFIVLGTRKRVSTLEKNLLTTDFSLPENFKLESFIRSVIAFSLVIELAGAIALYLIFLRQNVDSPLWNAIFHSISAFCTAGFSLFNNSFESFPYNFWLNLVIGILSYLGAIGFIVFSDIWQAVTGQKEGITFTSKIILKFTFWVSLAGAFIIFISEPGIESLAGEDRIFVAFFQSMTAMTTVGFNTFPIGELSASVTFLLILLMIVGASPSGTGGGVKSTTITAVYAQMMSTLRGENRVIFNKREIPIHRLRIATANISFYVLFLCIGIYLLTLTENFELYRIIFEATSAIGTVGLSTGITGNLSHLGKIVIIVLMFAGRVGPLSLGTALFSKEEDALEGSQDDLAI